jgi:Uma2 family endonuclease
MSLPAPLLDIRRARHLHPPVPRVFPEEAVVPETQLHLELRTILYQLLRDFLEDSVTLSSDQFVYWNADDPREVLAPDACVRRGGSSELIRSWKTWERGAPEVAVEIVSESDSSESAWSEKLARYRRMGVLEVLRFEPLAAQGQLRIWDRVEGDLIERVVDGDSAPSAVLPLAWQLAPADKLDLALRVRDGASGPLVPTRIEARRAEAEARRAEAEARAIAEARVAELEAELARRNRADG